jgi:hypothetical protein
VDPNRARGTQPTPRLYCSEGSPSALPFQVATGRRVRPASQDSRTEKPLGWQHDQPGQDASFSTNRPLFRVADRPWEGEENPTVLSRIKTCEPGDLPSTGMVPTLGRFPRCQHGGCRGDVLRPRVPVDPTVPAGLFWLGTVLFFVHAEGMRL